MYIYIYIYTHTLHALDYPGSTTEIVVQCFWSPKIKDSRTGIQGPFFKGQSAHSQFLSVQGPRCGSSPW